MRGKTAKRLRRLANPYRTPKTLRLSEDGEQVVNVGYSRHYKSAKRVFKLLKQEGKVRDGWWIKQDQEAGSVGSEDGQQGQEALVEGIEGREV